MDASRRAAAEAVSRRSVAYPTEGDVVYIIFNPSGTEGWWDVVRPFSVSVRPSSVLVVAGVCRESVVLLVRLVSQQVRCPQARQGGGGHVAPPLCRHHQGGGALAE
jgi:hypothetical protein